MTQQSPYIPLPPVAKRGVIAGASLLWFYNVFFTFAMPVALPALMQRYNTMAAYAMLGAVTALFSCLVTPIGGKLGDRFGRRRVCLIGSAVRLVFMLACAIPTNGTVFFLLFALGNLAGGLLNPYPTTILSDVTTAEERPRWFGVFGTINGVALVVGLLCGGLIVDYLGPFSIFTLTTVPGAASFVLLMKFYPNRPAKAAPAIDFPGIALLGGCLVCLLGWCSLGGIVFQRGSALGVALLAMGLLLGVLLFWREKQAPDPLIDLTLFRRRHYAVSFAVQMLIPPMVYLCSSVLVLFGQSVMGLSATASGTLAMPKNLLFCVLPSFLGGWISRDKYRFRAVFVLCGAAIVAGSLISAAWSSATPLSVIYLTMLIFGVGTSCQSVTIQPYMQLGVEQDRMGTATANLLFGSSIGGTVFSAVYNIFYNIKYAAAAAQGGGEHIAQAIAETFSAAAIFSAICGLLIMLAVLLLIPGKKKRADQQLPPNCAQRL